ncbi:MAG: glycoside hydrolase family 3 C-terminal domain-containing protein [Candidatus Theseobacter exili]|nr:glycoside hydrolase family 3 C-terminal domain-containing protein [Candidatus Theseobacter exili]
MRGKFSGKLSYFNIVCCLLWLLTVVSQGYSEKSVREHPYQNSALSVEKRVEDLLGRMSLKDKIVQLSGRNSMETFEDKELGIPVMRFTDGPHGVRDGKATCFPTSIAMGASWNTDLIRKTGAALGRETSAKGRHVLLGPCINIHRTPLGGRNFESFSEDPYLTARITVAYVQGVQSQGVGTSLKHFACNNQEFERMTISADIDERALREIYSPAFKAGVKEGGAWTVMAAYNRVNGEYCCANSHLLTDILKDEWGFKGIVLSDWGAVHSTVPSALAGLDLEMPGPGKFFSQALLDAVRKGKVSEECIDEKVRRILWLKFSLGLFDRSESPLEGMLDSKEHRELARKVAQESIVMLKNDRHILPLDINEIKSIAVFGPNASEARLGGGGSSTVSPFYSVSPLTGLKNICPDNIKIMFRQGCGFIGNIRVVPGEFLFLPGEGSVSKKEGLQGEYYNNKKLEGEPVFARVDPEIDFNWGQSFPSPWVEKDNYSVRWTGKLVPPQTGYYDLGLASDDGVRLYLDGKCLINEWRDHGTETHIRRVHLQAGKRYDIKIEYYENEGEALVKLLWSPPDTKQDKVEILAGQSDVAIVFAGLCKEIEGEGLDKKKFSLPEDQIDLIKKVSAANKNTIVVLINGSPVQMIQWIDNVPAVLEAWYPGQEGGNAIADVLFGRINPSGKLPVAFSEKLGDSSAMKNYPGENGIVKYAEGIFVGYRYFDKYKKKPLFAFGHGLSYTTFEYSNLKVSSPEPDNKTAEVSVDLQNTGNRKGKEVVQLYIRDIQSELERPEKELKAFKKVELVLGEKKTVKFKLNEDAFAYYHPKHRKWLVEPGAFEILIGSSSRDIRLRKQLNLN